MKRILLQLIQSMSGAEFAKLLQNYLFNFLFAGVRKGKKMARPQEINLPACLSPQSHLTEDGPRLFPPFIVFSISLERSFWDFFGHRSIAASVAVALVLTGVTICHSCL